MTILWASKYTNAENYVRKNEASLIDYFHCSSSVAVSITNITDIFVAIENNHKMQ